jgi:hypothetical protein
MFDSYRLLYVCRVSLFIVYVYMQISLKYLIQRFHPIISFFIRFMSIDSSLMFLVLKQFNWSDEEFSNLCLFRVLMNAVGIILMPQLLRLLPCTGGESIFVMIAIIGAGLSSALFAFAHNVQEVYAREFQFFN